MSRRLDLQRLLDAARAAIAAQAIAGSATATAAGRVFDRLDRDSGAQRSSGGARLPVCRHVDQAVANGPALPPPVQATVAAFAALEGDLVWTRRRNASPADAPFYDGHANTTIVGAGGIEERDDVWIGASVLAPNVTYVDHDHPPEEVYLALTPGEWWNARMDWTSPGVGGLIYNPPGILHNMRSGPAPFLALWFLPVG